MRLLAALVVLSATATWACCSGDDEDVFFLRVPDAPWAQTLERPGVVLPDFAPRHLALLYRSLSGVPLSALEKKALAKSWSVTYQETNSAADAEQAQERWRAAARKVLGAPADAGVGEDVSRATSGDYGQYLHVHDAAYEKALERLAVRQQRYAKAPELLRAWVLRQSEVLSVTFPGVAVPSVNPPAALATAWANDVAALDAAKAFYENRFEVAAPAFLALKGDEAAWGPYLAARAYLRWATLDATPEQRVERLAAAEAQLRGLESTDEALHGATQALLMKVLRLQQADWCPLLPRLMKKSQGGALPHLLQGLEQVVVDVLECETPGLAVARDFITTFAALDVPGWKVVEGGRPLAAKQAAARALAKWKAKHELPWLVAALTGADGTEADLPALLAAAHAVPLDGFGSATIALHEVRLLRSSKREAEARARLAELPLASWPVSTQNLFRLEQVLLSTSADEALAAVWLPKAGRTRFDGASLMTSLVEPESSLRAVSAALGGAEMVKASANPAVPLPVRQSLAWAGFARLVLLSPSVPLGDAVQGVLALDPAAKELESVRTATDATTARGLALRFLLSHPGVSVQVLAMNDRALGKVVPTVYERYGCANLRNGWDAKPLPAFVPSWASATGRAEATALRDGSGHVFARVAMAFATENPAHALAPELLHLSVQHSKFTAGEKDTKAAFQQLHKQFPKSPWTEKTPLFW